MINRQNKISLESLDRRIGRVEISIRKIGVQLDVLNHKFDLCIEGFGSLNEHAAKLEDRVSVLEGRAVV